MSHCRLKCHLQNLGYFYCSPVYQNTYELIGTIARNRSQFIGTINLMTEQISSINKGALLSLIISSGLYELMR